MLTRFTDESQVMIDELSKNSSQPLPLGKQMQWPLNYLNLETLPQNRLTILQDYSSKIIR